MSGLTFTVKFICCLLGAILGLLVIRTLLSYSPLAFWVVVSSVATILFWTAPKWVIWMPGIMVFGVANSLVGLVTRKVPTRSDSEVSTAVALLLCALYSVGCVVPLQYDARRISVLDRSALLVYIVCAIYPAYCHTTLASVTPVVFSAVTIGIGAMSISLVAHRVRRRLHPAES